MWRDSETSTNPAKEIFRALAPGMASVSQPLMLSISTPWAKEGQHYETTPSTSATMKAGSWCGRSLQPR